MKIGILSDTHDNIPKISKAVNFFRRKKVDLVLHAGDYIAPFSLLPLQKLDCPYRGVLGNNDGEINGLLSKSKGKIKTGCIDLKLEGRRIALIHDKKKINIKKKYDLVIFGHSHHPEIIKNNDTLFLNPGECGGWLTGKSTVAIVDLSNLSTEIFTI